MSIFNIVHVEEMCRRGSVKDADVTVLRNTLAAHRTLDASSIDDLFRINLLCHLQTRNWSEFFIEAVTDWFVREQQPTGYLTVGQMRYLFERIERRERIETRTEFDLLLNLLDKARWVPERLATAALKEIHAAIATGEGVLRGGQDRASGEVTVQDIADIRRVLYAFGGDDNRPLTRTEAEILCSIDECLQPAHALGEWCDLFTLSILNVMLAASGYRVPTREVALAARPEGRNGDADRLALARHIDQRLAAYARLTPEERAIQRLERQRIEIVTGEQVGEAEALWISERLDERFSAAPHLVLLISTLRDREVRMHPVLHNMMTRHARAA
jgi:hypothetical protein